MVGKGRGAVGQRELRIIHGRQDAPIPPPLTAADLPIGPLAGLELPLWRSPSGKAEHASAQCPHLSRGTPRQTRTIVLPTSGTLADLPAIPRCRSCPDPLPAYHQQATRLLYDAEELAKTATTLRNGYHLAAYGELLQAAQNDSLDTHQVREIDRLLQPALQRLRHERQRLVRQHRSAYSNDKARRDLKTITAAALLKADVDRRQPGRLRAELLDLSTSLVAEPPPDARTPIGDRELLELSDAWIAPISERYSNSAGLAELDTAKERLREGLSRLLTTRDPRAGRRDPPPDVDRLTTLLHVAWVGMLAGMVAEGSTQHVVVAVDPRMVLPLPPWAPTLLLAQYPSATRNVKGQPYRIAIVPKLFADLVTHWDRVALHVIAESTWPDDAAVCHAVLQQVPARAFVGDEPWWQRLRQGQLQRLLNKARGTSPRRLGD